jgi:hypothetical protein
VRYELGTSWNESFFERLTASRMRSRLDALRSFAKYQNGDDGLAKRVDENRELRDYLHRERAAFMASHSWVEGWIEGNAIFFDELQSALAVPARSSISARVFGADARSPIQAVLKLATTRGNTGGLLKRIDENRELLQYLQVECWRISPIDPAIASIIQRTDGFFTELLAILDVGIADGYSGTGHNRVYPRPWPLSA